MEVKVNRGILDQNCAFQIDETRNFFTNWISTSVLRPCMLPPRTFIVIKPNNVLRRVTIPTVQWAGSRAADGAGVPPEAAPAARTIATLCLITRSHHLARITCSTFGKVWNANYASRRPEIPSLCQRYKQRYLHVPTYFLLIYVSK